MPGTLVSPIPSTRIHARTTTNIVGTTNRALALTPTATRAPLPTLTLGPPILCANARAYSTEAYCEHKVLYSR